MALLVLALPLANAYAYSLPNYGSPMSYASQLGGNVYQRHVYDVQNIPRVFTHYRHNTIQTVRHHLYQYQDHHNIVDLYSNQYLDVHHPVTYGGSHWNPYSYSRYGGYGFPSR